MFDAIKTMIKRSTCYWYSRSHGVVLYAQELENKNLPREESIKQLLG